MISQVVRVSVEYVNAHRCWIATVTTGVAKIVEASARGRDKQAAVIDAIARFRTSRCLRRDISPGGKGTMLFGRWCQSNLDSF